eukprot:1724071-Lingulodinium_polyedra.AAC.1
MCTARARAYTRTNKDSPELGNGTTWATTRKWGFLYHEIAIRSEASQGAMLTCALTWGARRLLKSET